MFTTKFCCLPTQKDYKISWTGNLQRLRKKLFSSTKPALWSPFAFVKRSTLTACLKCLVLEVRFLYSVTSALCLRLCLQISTCIWYFGMQFRPFIKIFRKSFLSVKTKRSCAVLKSVNKAPFLASMNKTVVSSWEEQWW